MARIQLNKQDIFDTKDLFSHKMILLSDNIHGNIVTNS